MRYISRNHWPKSLQKCDFCAHSMKFAPQTCASTELSLTARSCTWNIVKRDVVKSAKYSSERDLKRCVPGMHFHASARIHSTSTSTSTSSRHEQQHQHQHQSTRTRHGHRHRDTQAQTGTTMTGTQRRAEAGTVNKARESSKLQHRAWQKWRCT